MTCESYDQVLMIIAVGTFVVSELLPFFKVDGNGLFHWFHNKICKYYNSECCNEENEEDEEELNV